MPGAPKLVLIGDTLVTLFRNMVRIRKFAEAIGEALDELDAEQVRPLVGLEAVAAGVNWHLGPEDLVFSSRPALSSALAKGVPTESLAAQWLRRATGCGGGAGGGRIFAAPEFGLLGVSDDTAAPLLNAVGAGMVAQSREQERLAVAFFGLGGLLDGGFHEALRTAGQHQLPALFIGRIAARQDIKLHRWATLAKTYGVAAVDADGRSVAEVYGAANEAVRRARAGEGPSLLLLQVATAPAGLELAAEDDPVLRMQNQLLEDQSLSEEELEEIDQQLDADIASAVAAARSAPSVDGD